MDERYGEEGEEDSEPNACYPFEKKGKVTPLWVNCERKERCMVGFGEVAVDVACARNLFLCSVLFQRKSV